MALPARTEEEDVVLGQLLQVILDDIWWLIAIAVTIVAMAALYCFVAKPIYSADAYAWKSPTTPRRLSRRRRRAR
jgi:tyrosine-protein kinase Etk/Wzc